MVTWKALGCIAFILIGLGMAGGGARFSIGAGMSDSVSNETMATGRRGCAWAVGGVVLVAVSIWGLVA